MSISNGNRPGNYFRFSNYFHSSSKNVYEIGENIFRKADYPVITLVEFYVQANNLKIVIYGFIVFYSMKTGS